MRLVPKLLALVPAAAIVAITTASTVQQAAPTPMELFTKMLPVIRHPRCSNCHGDVDPISGKGHGPGSVDPKLTPCTDCHIKGWELPGQDHFFPPRSDREVCGLFSDFASKQGHDLFITNHLRGDHLIVAAFEGRMGGVNGMGGMRDSTDPADPPGMDQEAFIVLAKDWLTRGQGACEVAGTISEVETVKTMDAWQIAPTVFDTVRQEGTRTATIKVTGNGYHADVKTEGTIVGTHIAHTTDAQGRPCISTLVMTEKYSAEGSGPAKVTSKDTVYFGDTDPAKGQTDYRIDVELPPEKGRSATTYQSSNTCGLPPLPLDPGNEDFEWDPAVFVLEGHLDDRRTGYLVGSCDRMVAIGDEGVTKGVLEMACNRFGNMGLSESPGLTRLANVAYHDGREIRFRVQTFWNLRYRK